MRAVGTLYSADIFSPALPLIPAFLKKVMAVFMPTHTQPYLQKFVGKQTWEFIYPRLEINTVS